MTTLFTMDGMTDDPGEARDRRLVGAYVEVGRTLDDLPYTDEFERVMEKSGEGDRRWVLHRLQNLRKAKKLPRLGRGESASVKVTEAEEGALRALVERDQLLYDPKFDGIVEAFNAKTGRTLSLHDAWRLIAKLAK
jgi:hypothetical protein